jgi:hypothetical protein
MKLALLAIIVTSYVAAYRNVMPPRAFDKLQILSWMDACDRFTTDKQKCDSHSCQHARHMLTQPKTRFNYVKQGMGPASDLDKYLQLQNACYVPLNLSLW